MPKTQASPLRAAERRLRTPVIRTLRFDEALRLQLEKAASRSVRSVNSEIVFRLRSTFRQQSTA
jgi:hypothetical protein